MIIISVAKKNSIIVSRNRERFDISIEILDTIHTVKGTSPLFRIDSKSSLESELSSS